MSIRDWQQHPQDFLVVYQDGVDIDGNEVRSYLITEYKPTLQSLAHKLVDPRSRDVVREMIKGGVLQVSIDQFNEMSLMKTINFRAYQENLSTHE